MARNPWGSEPHRFAAEDLFDLYPVVRRPNSDAPAPAKAGASVPSELGQEEAERKAEELAYDVRRTTRK